MLNAQTTKWISALVVIVLMGSGTAESADVKFADVASELGVRFVHSSPQSPLRHIHLTMGSGVGVADFDRDGWPDLYFAQGQPWDEGHVAESGAVDELFRNQLFRAERKAFSQVADFTTVASGAFGMGVAVGDSNNDGFPDLYVSRFGADWLLLNNGDGTFSKSAASLPNSTAGYCASCTWTEVNGDGVPDLFITRYVRISESEYPVCADTATGLPIVCQPQKYAALSDVLLVGDGYGEFADSSEASGLNSVSAAPGLAVVSHDCDSDGDLDILVANDAVPNHLWINDGTGQFEESGLIAGVAVNSKGLREAGMGIAVGDATGNGRADFVVTNYFAETNTFYRNEGYGLFHDVSDEIGVGAPSRSRLAFGVNFLDADGDGDLDLFVANGHIHDRLQELGRNIPYRQPPQLLTFDAGRYTDVSESVGTTFQKPRLGRGSATLDFNRDGRTDVIMTDLGGSPALFQNQTSQLGRQVRIRIVGRTAARDAVSTRVKFLAGEMALGVRFVDGSSSYLSTSEQVITFSAAPPSQVDRVEVQWPTGSVQTVAISPTTTEVTVVEGVEQPFAMSQ